MTQIDPKKLPKSVEGYVDPPPAPGHDIIKKWTDDRDVESTDKFNWNLGE
tara:strand:- start:11775 stop:11924 length:150 start_codon:yes stop_codon:yes gene_type:complete